MDSYWWWLAAVPLGAFAVGFLLAGPRKVLAGDMDAPMNLERGRAKSEAEMAAAETDVLPAAEAGEAAALVGHFRELATDEQPIVPTVSRRHGYRRPARWQRVAMRRRSLHGFVADPLVAAIPGRHRAEEPLLFGAAVEDWFSPMLAPATVAFPELPAEPDPWEDLSFTKEWTTADIARLVAEAKVEAAR